MTPAASDNELLQRLTDIPEVSLSGFAVREGLTGTGVTLLRGDQYFGSWRETGRELTWSYADLTKPSEVVASVDEAVHYTLLIILRNLESGHAKPQRRALAS
jgi:uncharacterized FlgJ-related protein